MSYKDGIRYNRYIALKYDKENGAIMPTHKKSELERYERIYAEQRRTASINNKKMEM